jgi:hypothetical protein
MEETQEAARAAMSRLEGLYQSLSGDEQRVLSELVRSAYLHAASRVVGEVEPEVPAFVEGLHPENARSLIASLHLPGQLLAYSPGCASRGLLEIAEKEIQP